MQKSVDALTKHFDLLKTILSKKGEIEAAADVTARDLDLARVYVGVAKGNSQMGNYFVGIQYDFDAVLNWKLSRATLPATKDMLGDAYQVRIMQQLSDVPDVQAPEDSEEK